MAAKKKQESTTELEVIKERNATGALERVQKKMALVKGPNGAIVIRAAADARLVSEVVNTDIPEVEKQIADLWGNDAKAAYRLYVSIRDKANRFLKPLTALREAAQAAVGAWQMAEQRRLNEQAAKEQKKLDKKMPDAGVVVTAEKVQIEGLTLTLRKRVGNVLLLKLIQEIAAGRAPLQCVDLNDAFLRSKARELWDTVEPDSKGQRWIYGGSVQLIEEPDTTRRG